MTKIHTPIGMTTQDPPRKLGKTLMYTLVYTNSEEASIEQKHITSGSL